jgi:RES domain
VVEIHRPLPKISVEPVLRTLPAGSGIVRIFDPSRHNTAALTFRSFGPLERFDHHGVDPLKPLPVEDLERKIYYAGFTLSCCLVEVFGDRRTIEVGSYCAAAVQTIRDLNLLDLRGAAAMKNGTVVGLSAIPDRLLTQEWSRFFYERTDLYPLMDGLIYPNAHNGEESLALYERSQDALQCFPQDAMPLNHKLLRAEIRRVAAENRLLVIPY